MITIIHNKRELKFPHGDFMGVQDTSDGIFIQCKDGSEIRLMIPVDSRVRTAVNVLAGSSAEVITVNFDQDPVVKIG